MLVALGIIPVRSTNGNPTNANSSDLLNKFYAFSQWLQLDQIPWGTPFSKAILSTKR